MAIYPILRVPLHLLRMTQTYLYYFVNETKSILLKTLTKTANQ